MRSECEIFSRSFYTPEERQCEARRSCVSSRRLGNTLLQQIDRISHLKPYLLTPAVVVAPSVPLLLLSSLGLLTGGNCSGATQIFRSIHQCRCCCIPVQFTYRSVSTLASGHLRPPPPRPLVTIDPVTFFTSWVIFSRCILSPPAADGSVMIYLTIGIIYFDETIWDSCGELLESLRLK